MAGGACALNTGFCSRCLMPVGENCNLRGQRAQADPCSYLGLGTPAAEAWLIPGTGSKFPWLRAIGDVSLSPKLRLESQT